MNNTKRKFLAGVIAAVVCFTMVLTSFGALIGAAFGILSNEDLINAINNGSLSLGDGVNLSNITLNGGTITNVAEDGYKAVSSNEVEEKTNDYTKYNAPYYAEKYADGTHTIKYADNTTKSFTVDYAASSTDVAPGGGTNTVNTNKIYYLANGMRSNATEGGSISTIKVTNAHLVIALATAEDIIAKGAPSQLNGTHYVNAFSPEHIEDKDNKFEFKKGIIKITNAEGKDEYVEADIGASEAVYGVCFKMTYLSVIKDASLTIVGRDFNENGYIDDLPVQVTVNNANYWIYEKVTLSGSSTYRQFAINEELFKANTSMIENYEGQAMPLISIYGGSTAAKAQKIIISGADLRNNFNNKKNSISDSSERDWLDDDANLGGGAIYLAAGSTNNKYITTDTCGYFSDVIITSSTFSYCGAARGGAIMVGKNFNATGCLDFSYSNFSYCYTVYDCYGRHSNALFNRITQSGDGGAICFYQDDTFTDPWSLYHNNPSLIVINEVDLTGADFKYCYAMRDGGAIFFGGYNYGADVKARINKTSNKTDSFRYYNSSAKTVYTANDELGTRITTLTIKDASFYGCGAGWMIDKAPVDANGNPLTGSSFIYTTTPGNLSDTIFAALEKELRLIDIVGGYSTTKNNALFSVVSVTSDATAQAGLRWMQSYDGGVGSPDNADDRNSMIWTDYKLHNSTANHPNSVRRHWNGWLNILQGYVKADYRRGGAMALNCRIANMVVSDTTFKYCATDSEGSAVYMDDFFVSPHVEFNNCLFENNLGTMSGTGTGTGTLRSTGLVAADVHVNNCSFLYNCNMNSGAVCMNLNNTYTGAEVGGVSYKVSYAEAGEQPNEWGYAGTEINNCVFFGNFAQAEGAAVKSSGVTDISSSTFAYNVTNNGEGGAIHFSSYDRIGVDVGSKTAHMRLDPKVGDGHTIICNNRVGGTAANDGGGAISIVASNSRSIGSSSESTDSATVSGKSISSRKFTFKFELGGLLIFDNYSAVSGGGILFRIDSNDPSTLDANYKTFAWLYDKIITLNNGYIFNNVAKNSGGGVAIFDEYSQLKAVAQSSIEGANIYNNSADNTGGGLYLYLKGGKVDVINGNVLGNTALQGGGIMITNTANVNITGGQIGSESYMSPAISIGKSQSTFGATSSKVSGANKATNGNGGGIYIVNELTAGGSDYDNSTTVAMTGGLVECNTATGDGGGIYMARPSANDTYGKITFNMSGSGTSYGFVGNNAANGGGIYVSSGGAKSDALRYTASISGGSISKNEATKTTDANGYGGGMFITGLALVELDGGSVSENKAGNNGGGIYINANAEFNMTGGELSANATDTMGGGIYAYNAPVNIDGGNIASNTAATNGGGACIRGGATLTMNGGNIATNTATSGNGGGVYVEHTYLTPADGNKTLYAAIWNLDTVSNNLTAAEEAKIRTNFNEYLVALGYDIDALDIHIDTITAASVGAAGTAVNNARADGKDYKVIISTGTNVDSTGLQTLVEDEKQMSTEYDTDKRRVALVSPETTLSRILYNMLINGSSASTVANPATISSATITAGNISGNTALGGNGGGLCCDNGSAVNLNASSDNKTYPVIDGNSAKNGGGIAAINGGDITMQGGYVTNNNAIGTSTFTSKVTTYQQSTHNGGVGGGIYVANPSGNTKGVASFSIVNYDTINSGIYLNNAEFAADDLYANAVETMISVPSFGGMKIKDGAGNVTGWYEDYATGEANYTVGLNGNKLVKSEYPIERYDKSETDKVFEAWVDAADKNADQDQTISSPDRYINGSNFVCVTLGAYVVYDGNLTITKDVTGTVDTEQVFVFHVRRTFDQYGNPTAAGDVDLYVTINVNASGDGSITIASLPLGTYEVTEITEWSWRYTIQSSKVEVANASGTYVAATDKSGTTTDDTVGIELAPANDTGDCNNPKITFVNELTKTPWLDGNSPKVVNTAGEATTTKKEVAFANFKREETLI